MEGQITKYINNDEGNNIKVKNNINCCENRTYISYKAVQINIYTKTK